MHKKFAKVIPVFKGHDAMQMNCYQPISLLNVFSKSFEKRIMHRIINQKLSFSSLLYKYQFGFRKGYVSDLALITMMQETVCCFPWFKEDFRYS